MNCLGRTCVSAGSAVNAYIGVDLVMLISLGDSFCRTFSLTGAAAYTIVGNNICHNFFLLDECSVILSILC